ncbi:MAG: hypothetical protein WAL29_13260 [Bacteroidales bacterium]
MTRQNIIGSLVLTVLISLNISGCKSRSNNGTAPVNTGVAQNERSDLNELPDLKEEAVPEKVIFFIENSGSMFGYVNQANEFKNSLVGLAYLPEFDRTEKSFYFINGTSNPVKNSRINISYIGDDPDLFKNKLDQKSFNTGDVRFSDLNKMFEIALDSAEGNRISVLVSDCIYDVGAEKDPLTALKIEIQKTQQSFRNKLGNNNIQTLIIKAYSRFDGLYHYASKGGSERIQNEERPFYIIFFGKTRLLNKVLTEQSVASKIEGPFETARFFLNDEKEIFYQIVPSIGLKGDFKPDFKDKHKLINARPLKNEFQFAIATDFRSLPFSDRYLTSTANYECPYSNFNVVKVEKITKSIPGVEGTHLITVFTDKNPVGNLEIVLKNLTPAWVMETDTDNEDNIDSSHTFGFRQLIDAIGEAYEYKNSGKNPATFKIQISK